MIFCERTISVALIAFCERISVVRILLIDLMQKYFRDIDFVENATIIYFLI